MPAITGGGASNITGANIVDASISGADLAATALDAFIIPSLSCYPLPLYPLPTSGAAFQAQGLTGNTAFHLCLVKITDDITVNKVTFRASAATVAGTVKFALYSENGQTQYFTGTTASISGAGLVITTLGAAVRIRPGNYYFGVLPVGTCNVDLNFITPPDAVLDLFNSTVTGEPLLNGQITVTASTIPATVTPTAISTSTANSQLPVVRFDN